MTPGRTPGATRARRPNDRAQRTAAKLLGIAPDITRAVELLREEQDSLGYPRTSTATGKISGGGLTIAVKHWDNGIEETDHVPATTVEKTVIDGGARSTMRQDLGDHIRAAEDAVSRLDKLTRRILGLPNPSAEQEPLCADKQMGREGVIEWGDPTCTELPLSNYGVCSRCYHRERRWRAERGLVFRGEPAP